MKVNFRDIVDSFQKTLASNSTTVVAFVAAIAAIYSFLDIVTKGSGEAIAQIVIGIFGQYLLTAKLLADRMPSGVQRPAYGSIFGAGILSGLGILVGLIFLILPGIYLMGRWSMVTPLIVAEGKGATESLGASWERSEQSANALFVTYLIGTAFFVFAFLGLGFTFGVGSTTLEGVDQTLNLAEVILANLLVSALSVLGWGLACAIYRTLTPADHLLNDIFA